MFPTDEFMELIKRGEGLREAGHPEKAVPVFRQALEAAQWAFSREEALSDGFYYLGIAQREAGLLDEAEQNLSQALQRYSLVTAHPRGVVDCMNQLAMIHEDQTSFERALHTLEQARMLAQRIGYHERLADIELNMRNVNARMKIHAGMAHAGKREWEQALADLRQAVDLNSGVTSTRAYLAIVCAQYGETLHIANRAGEAEKLYRESISNGDHLVKYFSDTLPLLPLALSSAYYHLALIEEARGPATRRVIGYYEKAIALNPSMTPAYNNLANAILVDDPCRALKLYRKFVQLVDAKDAQFQAQARTARSHIARLAPGCPE